MIHILPLRRRLRLGPHQLSRRLGLSPSTVYGVLRRHGLSRQDQLDRYTGGDLYIALTKIEEDALAETTIGPL